ncbi:GNAT family N-acetyltransferase [Thermodesulfobacteriota bacterium]
MEATVVKADYLNNRHEEHIQVLLNSYASDPMGGGIPLEEEVRRNVVKELSKLPHAFSVIAYLDGVPVGLANCFEAFSTFSCKPIVNIHDIVVLKEFRGNGISHKLLEKIEEIARSRSCCKLTLEVLSRNEVAKISYEKFGFSGYELDPKLGKALFWQKKL